MPDEENDRGARAGLATAYTIESPEEAKPFYDDWAERYDDEVEGSGYITPKRCAEALAQHASLPWAPVMDLACGTGLSGVALRAAGFECIDGFDLSEEMLARAREKGVYRELAVADLSKPLEIEAGKYQNAAAIGCVSPEYMPATVIDRVLETLPSGGCFVFSVNDHAAKDGTIKGRINDLVDCGVADFLFSDYGDHLPEIGMGSTVYVLRKK